MNKIVNYLTSAKFYVKKEIVVDVKTFNTNSNLDNQFTFRRKCMPLSVQVKKNEKLLVATKQLNMAVTADLSWDPLVSGKKADADLFLAATTYNSQTAQYLMPDMSYLVYHSNLTLGDAVKHTGDEQSGAKEGVDERIIAFLNKLNSEITDVFIGVCIDPIKSPGMTFSDVTNLTVKVNLITEGNDQAVEKCYSILSTNSDKGLLVGKFYRIDAGWEYINLDTPVTCTSSTPISDVLEAAKIDAVA
ncbi:MAG: TerD family protein [Patescibacteria group bacterium]